MSALFAVILNQVPWGRWMFDIGVILLLNQGGGIFLPKVGHWFVYVNRRTTLKFVGCCKSIQVNLSNPKTSNSKSISIVFAVPSAVETVSFSIYTFHFEFDYTCLKAGTFSRIKNLLIIYFLRKSACSLQYDATRSMRWVQQYKWHRVHKWYILLS